MDLSEELGPQTAAVSIGLAVWAQAAGGGWDGCGSSGSPEEVSLQGSSSGQELPLLTWLSSPACHRALSSTEWTRLEEPRVNK